MKYQLVNVGRAQVCKEVEVADEMELYREVSKYLASRAVDIAWQDESQNHGIVEAGFHRVGEVLKIQ